MSSENLPKIKIIAMIYEPRLHAIFPQVLCIENTLDGLKKIIGCDYVACTEIEVAGKDFDVWSDDEALLRENPVPNLYINENLILFGNLIFAKHDEEGATLGIYNSEIRLLQKFYQNQYQKLRAYFENWRKK